MNLLGLTEDNPLSDINTGATKVQRVLPNAKTHIP